MLNSMISPLAITDAKRKGESIDSWIPNQAKQGSTKQHCTHCKKHGGAHTTHNTKECHCFNKDSTPKTVGSTPRPQKKKRGKDGAILCRLFIQSARKSCPLPKISPTVARNVEAITTKVIVTPTLTSEVLGQITQGNEMYVRNLKLVPSYVILIPVQTKLSIMQS